MKQKMGRVAITSRGSDEFSEVDESFGRAYWFLIYDEKEQIWQSIDNSSVRESPGGAGVSAAQTMKAAGVTIVVTGETGPKAHRALTEAGIQVFYGAAGSVMESYQALVAGKLVSAMAANNKCNPFCLVNGGVKTEPYMNWFHEPEIKTKKAR